MVDVNAVTITQHLAFLVRWLDFNAGREKEIQMKISEARSITGGLSNPSKVGSAWSIPIKYCITGSKLRKVKGSVCYNCYAGKNRYAMPNVQDALDVRYEKMSDPRWVDGMVILIQRLDYFRWFDSGDIQSLKHLDSIVEVAKRTPDTMHWLPTKEHKIVQIWRHTRGEFPDNLVVRLSMHMVDEYPTRNGLWSSVTNDLNMVSCPSSFDSSSCESHGCRKCWDKSVYNVTYKNH